MDMSAAEEKIGTAPVEEVVSRDAKGAVEYFIDPAEEKKVVWKIDRVIMSLMFVGFFFQCTSTMSTWTQGGKAPSCTLLTAILQSWTSKPSTMHRSLACPKACISLDPTSPGQSPSTILA